MVSTMRLLFIKSVGVLSQTLIMIREYLIANFSAYVITYSIPQTLVAYVTVCTNIHQ